MIDNDYNSLHPNEEENQENFNTIKVKSDLEEVQELFNNNALSLQTKFKEISEIVSTKLSEINQKIKFLEKSTGVISLENEQKTVYFRELLNIIRDLNSDLTLDTLLEKILDVSIGILQADRGMVMLFNKSGELEIKMSRDNKKVTISNDQFKYSDTVINRVLNEGRAIFISDLVNDMELSNAESISDMEIRSIMCAPLGKRNFDTIEDHKKYPFLPPGQILGMIYLDNKTGVEEKSFIYDNLDLLQAFADQASIALLNAILYENMNIDDLTGLYLRQHFEQTLESELNYASQNGSCLSIFMIDIDFFKFVNDKYGHQVGDEVLHKLGLVFKKELRQLDTCGRFGGEEFIIILPGINSTEAYDIAESLRELVKTIQFTCGTITISIGISSFPEHCSKYNEDETSRLLIKYADQALYFAKESGRDRSIIWNQDINISEKKLTSITDILTGNPIRDYRNVQMLLEVIKIVTSKFNPDELLKKILDLVLKFIESDRGLIMLYNEDKKMLEIKVCRTRSGEKVNLNTIKFSTNIVNEVFQTGREICMHNVFDEFESSSILELELKSVMCVPLEIDEQRIGVIYIDSKSTLKEFTRPELSYFSAIALQVSIAIEKFNTTL